MDLSRDNPVGRVPDFSRTRRAEMIVSPRGWSLGRRSGTWSEKPPSTCMNALDGLHEITLKGTPGAGQTPTLERFARVAIARGTFLTRDGLTLPSREELSVLLPPSDHSVQPGDLSWDVAAVRQRRSVLAGAMPTVPSLSAVLVTRRPSLVVPMVQRLAAMDYTDLEIVVALHGQAPPAGVHEAAGDRPVSVHQFPAGMVFGRVLREAFARASGALVTKIDDDDFYGPDHLTDLVLAHRYSGATLVGKATTVVHLEALDTTVRRVFGRWESFTHRVAGGTMLISAEHLKDVGGWAEVPRGVDTALLDRVREAGAETYYPHDIGYLYVRDAGEDHTWETDVSHFLRNTRQQWVGLLKHPDFGTHVQ